MKSTSDLSKFFNNEAPSPLSPIIPFSVFFEKEEDLSTEDPNKVLSDAEKYQHAKLYVQKRLEYFLKDRPGDEIVTDLLNILDTEDTAEDQTCEILSELIGKSLKEIEKKGKDRACLSPLLIHLLAQIQNFDDLRQWGISNILPAENKGQEIVDSILSAGIIDTLSKDPIEAAKMIANLPSQKNPVKTYPDEGLPDDILDKIDVNNVSIIYVSGQGNTPYNPFGHAILRLGGQGYMHINTLRDYPQHIPDEDHFAAYLRTQGGKIIGVQRFPVRYPGEFKSALKNLSGEKWFWKVTHNNCLSFAQTVAFAGGATKKELGYKRSDAKLPLRYLVNKNGSEGHLDAAYLNPALYNALDLEKDSPHPSQKQYRDYQKEACKLLGVSKDRHPEALEYYANLRHAGLSSVKVCRLFKRAHPEALADRSLKDRMESKIHRAPRKIANDLSHWPHDAASRVKGFYSVGKASFFKAADEKPLKHVADELCPETSSAQDTTDARQVAII